MAAFRQVDMSRNFYFSPTYDLTSSLQANLTRPGYSRNEPGIGWTFNDRFAWNHHMLVDGFASDRQPSGETGTNHVRRCWILPMIYGAVDQASE